MITKPVPRYGVIEQSIGQTVAQQAASIRLVGYAVVDSGYAPADIEALGAALDIEMCRLETRFGGIKELAAIGEHNTVRAPLAANRAFLSLATNARVLEICRLLMGDYIVLNQQNGILNPPDGQHYNQGAYHRDLPYQHFVSSRPLAVNAIFCIDAFTRENGATLVVPASHKAEAFPPDEVVEALQVCVEARAGQFILLDSMLFHRGGLNITTRGRRGVNQVYAIPYIRQQIDLPAFFGPDFSSDPATRRLLGYDVQTPRDIESYYEYRRKKTVVTEKETNA